MANVFKFIKRQLDIGEHSEQENLDLDLNHVHSPIDGSLCGIQTDGEGGIEVTDLFEGAVTCRRCRLIIESVQKIKNWK